MAFDAVKDWPNDLYVIPEYSFAIDCTGHEIKISSEHTEYRWANYNKSRLKVKRYP